jgi:hypothetical protein
MILSAIPLILFTKSGGEIDLFQGLKIVKLLRFSPETSMETIANMIIFYTWIAGLFSSSWLCLLVIFIIDIIKSRKEKYMNDHKFIDHF